MKSWIFLHAFLGFLVFSSCQGQISEKPISATQNTQVLIEPNQSTIFERFLVPRNFKRIESEVGSYATYLRNLALKPIDAEVRHFDGSIKKNRGVYVSVVDKKIGTRDLHQCADAVMRLRAEYLWEKRDYDQIHFNFTNGFQVDYTEWMKGRRVVVKGNKTYWNDRNVPSSSYEDFWRYLEIIFAYAGTLSLEKELVVVKMADMEIGDVLIQGGTPGHAVTVVDMAQNKETGKKLFMLGQSYMPAQEIQILANPNSALSPWYELDDYQNIRTPEWTFNKGDLRRFK